MKHRSTPTIVDVARVAGVSKSLVSLAIRNDPGVAAETRARILRVADDLGYHTNRWASSLVRGRTQLVGVLLTDLSNAYHTDIVIGVEEAAAEAGLEVVISHGRRDPGMLAERLDSLVRLGMDGIVVVSAHTPPEALASAARRTPTVVVGRPEVVPPTVSSVCNDDEAGATMAVEHLLGLGHERIAFVQYSQSAAARARRDAYFATMAANGLAARVIPSEGIESAIGDLAGAGAPARPGDGTHPAAASGFTAVFASNDRGAARTAGAALDRALRIPEDLAVIGYDDTELASLMRPALSSIRQPRFEMGRRAMEIIQGEEVVREVHCPELVGRASTVPVRPPGRLTRGAGAGVHEH